MRVHRMTTGQRISWLMTLRGVTATALASRLGVHPNTLRHYRRDERDVPGRVVAALARELDTTADFLLGLSDDPGELAR